MQLVQQMIPRNQGNILETAPKVYGSLRDSSDALDDVSELHRRMKEDGYLFLPGQLHREEVLEARHEICRRLSEAGVLDPDRAIDDAILGSNRPNAAMPDVSKNNPYLAKVLYDGPMIAFWRYFLGGAVRHFDYTWFRTISPGYGTQCHCDIVYMGRGTSDLYTAWTPIGDISLDLGGLMILEGSNNHDRLRNSYGKMDVDAYCSNRQGPAGLDGWQKTHGWLGRDPNQIRRSLGGRWLTCDEYRAGDVLVFSVYTVHAGLDNQTANRLRLSSDSRYQLASEPADPRWVGENPVGHGAAGKLAKIC